MNTEMTFPLIVLSGGFVKGYKKNIIPLRRCNLYGLVNRFYEEMALYDQAGNVWKVDHIDSPYQVNFWNKLLATSFYNPRFTVKLQWKNSGTYTFPELQKLLCDVVDKDDDLLTQEISREDLMQLIQQAPSFDEMFEVLKKKRII